MSEARRVGENQSAKRVRCLPRYGGHGSFEEPWVPFRGAADREQGIDSPQRPPQEPPQDPRVGAYERLIQQLDHSPLGAIEWGPDFRVTRWSTRAREIFGWREEEVLDKHFNSFAFVHPEERARVEAGAIQLRHGDALHTIRQNRNLRKDGSTIHCEWYNSVIRDEGGELRSVLSLVYEVTAREEAKQRARESEQHLDLALRAAGMGLWDWDLVTGRRHFDARAARALGPDVSLAVGSPGALEAHVHPEDLPRLRAAQEEHLGGGNECFSVEYRVRTRTGEWRWFLDRGQVVERDPEGRPLRSSGTLLDVNERRTLEEGLHQSQKMEALGTLAGGVAHEFNNILLAIFGYVELAADELPANQPARAHLEQVMKAARRAETLVEQILAFGRNGGTKEERVDLTSVVQDACRESCAAVPQGVVIQGPERPAQILVSGDADQLKRMLRNLLCNAVDALGELGGTVRVCIDPVRVERELAASNPSMRPGEYVRLVITDTGCGMDTGKLERACEPFYTTKQASAGTGLGLSVVHGIVRAHGGAIKLKSEVGFGSAVEIYLPRLGAVKPVCPSPAPASLQAKSGQGAHILVVDDEPVLADLSGRILKRAGFSVLVCTSGAEALTEIKSGAPIDLLLTDRTMPGQDGLELAERAKELIPELPVVLVSGSGFFGASADDATEGEGLIAAILSKPYGADELTETVRRALTRSSRSKGAHAIASVRARHRSE